MKPIADGVRMVPPFGSPKREGEHEQPRRNSGGSVVRLIHPTAEPMPVPSDRALAGSAGDPASAANGRPGVAGLHYRPRFARRV